MFFGPIGKTRWPPWPLISWDIFDFSSETVERNSSTLDRKQDLNVLYWVCVFRANRKNKMAALASDWLRHFRLLLWNCWTEFNETWQEARSQCPLPSLCFSGRSEKQDGGPGLWLAETFSTSPLKPLNGIQRILTGSKISTPSTKFVFFWPISKQKCPPWPIPQKGGTLYSGARYVALWASCLLTLWHWPWSLTYFSKTLKCCKNEHSFEISHWDWSSKLSWMQNFVAIQSAALEKMTFEVAIFCNFLDIPELKLSLPPWHMDSRVWHWVEVRLAELLFLYFL